MSNSEIINTAETTLFDELAAKLQKYTLEMQEAERWVERSINRLYIATKEYEKAKKEADEDSKQDERAEESDDEIEQASSDDEQYTASEICMMKSFRVEDAKKILNAAQNELSAAKKLVKDTEKELAAAQK